MAQRRIAILDYGSGNLRSAQRALERVGALVEITQDESTALAADGLVVPGVGAFGACMSGLRRVHGPRIIERRLSGGRAVLGICVGMQVMFSAGVEPSEGSDRSARMAVPVLEPGLDQWPGVVERLSAPVLPHMGWNTVRPGTRSQLLAGMGDERFYFVHSYAVRRWESSTEDALRQPPIVSWSTHGEDFVAAVENGPLAAVQFHPEKSGDAGLMVLQSWLATLP